MKPPSLPSTTDEAKSPAGPIAGYSPREPQPLPEFAALIGTFCVLVSTALVSVKKEKGRLPDRLTLREGLVLALATHKFSRLLTLDWVTSPLRAPFTRFEDFAGEGEVSERARGSGMRRVIGELLSCPYCAGVWTASGFRLGRALAPRLTNIAAEIFALAALSNFLQHAYVASKPRN